MKGKKRKNYMLICNLDCQSGEQIDVVIPVKTRRRAEKRRINIRYKHTDPIPWKLFNLVFRLFIAKLFRNQANNLNTDEIQVRFTKVFERIMVWLRHDRQIQCRTAQIQYNLQSIFSWSKNWGAKQAAVMSHKREIQIK